MSIQAIRLAKTNKTFVRNSFRKVIVLLFFSLVLNALFAFGIYNKFINRETPPFYATNGITPPIELNPLSHPNYSSKPLLEDQAQVDGVASSG